MNTKFASNLLKTAALVTVVVASNIGYARNPVGERADYRLDRNSARTSSMIKSGTIQTRVTKEVPDASDGLAFETAISYDFDIQFVGRQQGTELVNVDEEFFTEEFLEKLRTDGTYESPDFKIKHEGFADARNLDGKFYPHCDKLLFYDIKTERSVGHPLASSLANLLEVAASSVRPDPNATIEDMKIRVHVSVGVPVLGAVKLDMSGKYSGMAVKAGADYIAP